VKKNNFMLCMESKIERPKNFFAVFAGVLFLDQLLKNIYLSEGLFQKNYAALFGIKADPIFSIVTLIIFLFSICIIMKNKKDAALFSLPLALVLAGIAGNIVDRLHFGFIVDWIKLSNEFIFNLADIAILLGTILFIWRIIKE